MTQKNRVYGTIGRASIDRILAADSEYGREYWTVSVYEYRQGIWHNIGAVVSGAPSKDAARAAAVEMGLGGVPQLGPSEFSLDGLLRGRDYVQQLDREAGRLTEESSCRN